MLVETTQQKGCTLACSQQLQTLNTRDVKRTVPEMLSGGPLEILSVEGQLFCDRMSMGPNIMYEQHAATEHHRTLWFVPVNVSHE